MLRSIVRKNPEQEEWVLSAHLLNPDGYQLAENERNIRAKDMPDRSVFYVDSMCVVADSQGVVMFDQEACARDAADVREEIAFDNEEWPDVSRVLKVDGMYFIDESFANLCTSDEVKERFYMPEYLELPLLHHAIAEPGRFVPVLGWVGNEAQLDEALNELAEKYCWRVTTPNILYVIHAELDDDDGSDDDGDDGDNINGPEPGGEGPDGDMIERESTDYEFSTD